MLVVIAAALAVAVGAGVPGASAERATAARTVDVSIGDDFFKPRKLSVVTGTRVHWVWGGESEHNVTVISGPAKFHSEDQVSGEFTRKLRKPGTYRLVCTIHGFHMRIKVHKP
ncbi:MAG TPA: cupredoxin domain-containing protein [Thermoleophilaceae bacterium]